MSGSIITCRVCSLTQRLEPLPRDMVAECPRCGSTVAKAKQDNLRRAAALSLAALLLYVPANIYPVLRMDLYGVHTENTVWDGCVRLFQSGEWFVGTIVFLASLLIPLVKLLGLFYLVVTTHLRSPHARRTRALILKVIVAIGSWAMLDVFLLAILVALVRLGQIATVTPGPGILAFASVVVLTILASASFDPKQLWGAEHSEA
jgi:paraquat-inducible protein A